MCIVVKFKDELLLSLFPVVIVSELLKSDNVKGSQMEAGYYI